MPINEGLTVAPKRFVLKRAADLAQIDESRFKVRYEQELNPAQFEAVKHKDGPALVIAGAGTGKTRTLTYRVARLVEQGVDPKSILLLTFTRRASQEMLRRASALLHDRAAENVAGGTFHSFANLTLRKYAAVIGFSNNFSILDAGDSHDVINLLRSQMGVATARRRFPKKTTLGAMFSLAVNRLMSVEEVVENDFPHFREDLGDILRLHGAYHAYKRKANAMDYDDLLTNLVLLLETDEKIRRSVAQKYRYIMVDEYQDVNRLQARIVQLLSGDDSSRANVMVVGDDAQSIYRFRGAEVENIFDFPKEYPGAKIIPLEENYRSTQPILTMTNHIISLAARRYEKTLFTRSVRGEMPQVVCAESEAQQSLYVVEKILEYREMGVGLNDIAVLFRSGYMSFDLELELQRANIPFQKFGGMKFIETSHIKDLTAMLRVIENPKDAVSWFRILLLHDGVGPKTAERIVNQIVDSGFGFRTSDIDSEEAASPSSPAPKVSSAIQDLFGALKFVASERMTPPEKVEHLIEYYKPILRRKYDDYQKREKDIETFQLITERYRSLTSLLSDLSLDPPSESLTDIEETTKDNEILTLSTIHSAKGLEWNAVIITNCLDGRFPSVHAARDQEDLEEERRLMYVAATRAKEHLIITYPTNLYDRESGIVLSKPSRFIDGVVEKELAEGWVIAQE
ncbi:MAG: ATP-dependent helicase [Bacteroidota bacterium]|nr:ATP-dependent helicase [Bacteroidota bacterium]